MSDKRLNDHFRSFEKNEIFDEVSVFLVTKDGQVLNQLGKRKEKDPSSLGALFVGILQASEAVSETLSGDKGEEMDLSYSSSRSGFFILKPTKENPEVFWAFMYRNTINPGKVKVYAKKLRDHFDRIKILEKQLNKNGKKLFEDITDDEMDKLFSFAGI